MYSVQVSISTTETLLDLVEEISTSLENNKYVVGVFSDPKKAFDTVDHDILCKNCIFMGCVVSLTNGYSYLENRKQFVSFNSCDSEILNE